MPGGKRRRRSSRSRLQGEKRWPVPVGGAGVERRARLVAVAGVHVGDRLAAAAREGVLDGEPGRRRPVQAVVQHLVRERAGKRRARRMTVPSTSGEGGRTRQHRADGRCRRAAERAAPRRLPGCGRGGAGGGARARSRAGRHLFACGRQARGLRRSACKAARSQARPQAGRAATPARRRWASGGVSFFLRTGLQPSVPAASRRQGRLIRRAADPRSSRQRWLRLRASWSPAPVRPSAA